MDVSAITKSPKSLCFLGLSRTEVEADCRALGVSALHARDLFRAAYKEFNNQPWQREGLPRVYAQHCDRSFDKPALKIAEQFVSQYDGSVKFVVELGDKTRVETVLMPESKRVTVCISSQVGCDQGCVFCHTGRMGLVRQLSAGEIVGQVWLANRWIKDHPEWLLKNRLPSHQLISNVVFMGMGEPLDNAVEVAKAITILIDPFGMNIAKRRISVSTAGHLEGLDQLVAIHPDARLAISVHSGFDQERSKIMPINRRWPLAQLIEKLRTLRTVEDNGILVQYTLISGVNDSTAHAEKLIELFQGMNVKVNIIPLNPVGPSRLKSPDMDRLESFRDVIFKSGLRVMVRYSKGQDIAAACGQLVSESKN